MHSNGTLLHVDADADRLMLNVSIPLGLIYITAKVKAILFFDLLPLTHRCSINIQLGNNATYPRMFFD